MYIQKKLKGNKMFYPGNHDKLNDRLRQIIAEDRAGVFQAIYIDRENHLPEVNFQTIAIQWLDGQSWEQMAENFEISTAQLRMFYYQSLRGEFQSYLRELLEE